MHSILRNGVFLFCFIQFTLGKAEFYSYAQSSAGKIKVFHSKASFVMPFRLVHGIPVLALTFNGKSNCIFLLDSGTERSILNSVEIAGMRLEQTGPIHQNVLGLGGSGKVLIQHGIKRVKIKSGRHKFIRGAMFVGDLSEFSKAMGEPVTGIIGYDILRQRTSILDYEHRTFSFMKNFQHEDFDSPHSVRLVLDPSMPLPIVPAVDFHIDVSAFSGVRLEIDTGSDGTAYVMNRFAAAHSLASIPGLKPENDAGINGVYHSVHGADGWVTFGQKRLPLLDITILTSPVGDNVASTYDVGIGSEAFSGRTLIFDGAHGFVYIVPST